MIGSSSKRGLIAHILPFEEIGGTELQTLRLAQAAESIDFDNVVYYPENAETVAELFRAESFRTEPYEQVEPSYTHPGAFWRASRALSARFKSQGVDIVHGADLKGAHHTGLAGRLAGARVLCHVRNAYPAMSFREQGFLLGVHQFVFVSHGVKKTLRMPEMYKTGPVIYDVPAANGSALFRDRSDARQHFCLPPDAFVIGTAARLAPQKDYETLIRAARFVLDTLPGTRFLVAGDIDGPEHRKYYNALLSLLAETRTQEAFHFAGFQSDMSWFYGACDAVVLSSNWEGLGTVPLEAMLNKKPLVTTDIEGFREIVSHGKTGLLAPPKSPQIMANHLIELLINRERAQELVQAATKYFEANFSGERFVRQIDNLYSAHIPRKRDARHGIAFSRQ